MPSTSKPPKTEIALAVWNRAADPFSRVGCNARAARRGASGLFVLSFRVIQQVPGTDRWEMPHCLDDSEIIQGAGMEVWLSESGGFEVKLLGHNLRFWSAQKLARLAKLLTRAEAKASKLRPAVQIGREEYWQCILRNLGGLGVKGAVVLDSHQPVNEPYRVISLNAAFREYIEPACEAIRQQWAKAA